jgi:hypothetical protein
MRRLNEGWRRVRSLGRRNELEAGLDDEIRFHIDRQTEKNLRAGMAADEARRQAFIKFGGSRADSGNLLCVLAAPLRGR